MVTYTKTEMDFIWQKEQNRTSGLAGVLLEFFFSLLFYLVLFGVFFKCICFGVLSCDLFDLLVWFGFFSLPVGCGSHISPSQQTANVTSCRGRSRQGWQGRWRWMDSPTDGQRDEGLSRDVKACCSRPLQRCPGAQPFTGVSANACARRLQHDRHASSGFMGRSDYSER